jgi:hypothetical protein
MYVASSLSFLNALFSALSLVQGSVADDDAIKSVPLRTHSLSQVNFSSIQIVAEGVLTLLNSSLT